VYVHMRPQKDMRVWIWIQIHRDQQQQEVSNYLWISIKIARCQHSAFYGSKGIDLTYSNYARTYFVWRSCAYNSTSKAEGKS
jgi:hypothetical protein